MRLSAPSLTQYLGPVSGTLVQPYIGILSDNCRISWGKRKPFMLAGGAATIISLVCLAWTREIVRTVLGKSSPHLPGVTIAFAVLMVYILDFSINTGTIMSSLMHRCFINGKQSKLESEHSLSIMHHLISKMLPTPGPVGCPELEMFLDIFPAMSIYQDTCHSLETLNSRSCVSLLASPFRQL